MPFVRHSQSAEAIAAFHTAQQERRTAVFLCFGSEDPTTGESWCPDCVVADPVIRGAVAAGAPGAVIHECPVGLRSAWKGNSAHPLRQDPGFRLERIPTLIRLDGGVETGRLVEAACSDRSAVTAFLSGLNTATAATQKDTN
jgi:hypothetical protein